LLTEHDALLVVDVQRDFLPGGALGVANGDEVVPLLAACMETFERQQLPIIASRDWHPVDHCSFQAQGGPWPPHCIAGTAGSEIDPALNLPPGVETVDKASSVEKDAYSAFEDTELDPILRKKGVNRVFIGGLATEYCVLNTARDALTRGYDVVVLEDAIRAIDPAAGKDAIEELRSKGASICQSRDLLDGSCR
jgi:nicotinamidase/pyrazinamidase